MSKRNQFDDVRDSLVNGQRTQAFQQMQEIGTDDLAEMLDYFVQDLCNTDLALDAAKTYFRKISR